MSHLAIELTFVLDDALRRLPEAMYPDDLLVYSFPQTWPSTSLGHGGMGGASVTQASTWLVTTDDQRIFAVYFGRRFAYAVDLSEALNIIERQRAPSVRDQPLKLRLHEEYGYVL